METLPQYRIELNEYPSSGGQYPPDARWRRPAWLLEAWAERGIHAIGSHRFDAVIFQRELISTLVTLEPLFRRPRLLDVDDAIWLHRRGSFAGKLAAECDAVICGNTYLAEYFGKHCERIFLLPTGVDARRFAPLQDAAALSPIIGWSGTSSNLAELESIEPALSLVMQRFPESRLRVVCDRRPRLSSLPAERLDYVPWTAATEVSVLQDLRVGLMPLQDTAWARGKCALKMLTYMACGLPVVVSPVGMNAELLAMGGLGFGARTHDDWVDALTALLSDGDAAKRMGRCGRAVVEADFSVEVLSPRLAEIIRAVAD